jgi:NADH-quinone oxidoreductase subunit G
MSNDDQLEIEVNGVTLPARKGQMLIEATDAAGIYIPRFCYHEKLSIAANCRMCLVEVEKAPKPLPACATPVMDGMKVFTASARAISAQKATMEFLLINHPLDCPICDQGGECELQDLAMGYGRGVSRYSERKRVVRDKNLGPLISTDMTRCIHCTRCVRFGQEIAGIQELGTTGRGEHTQIGTYVEKSVDHEMSGNIIDLCPVGALNNKPYRFSARAWEMTQHASVAAHDCVGSNMFAHVYNGIAKRIVPQPNEAINETWLSDRDRFSFEGIYAADRLQSPRIRIDGEWRDCDWDEALSAVAEGLKGIAADHGPEQISGLISPSATSEEHFLFARLLRGLGSVNIDHRIRRVDFHGQEADPVAPGLGMTLADLEAQQALLVVGSDLRQEVPIAAHRVRKAAVAGADVFFVNPGNYEYLFPVAGYLDTTSSSIIDELAGLVLAAFARTETQPDANLAEVLAAAEVRPEHEAAVAKLIAAERATVLLGLIAGRHPGYSRIRMLAAALAAATGAQVGSLTEGANSGGAAMAGTLPHRICGGAAAETTGLNAAEIIAAPTRGMVLMGIEPELDCANAEGLLERLADTLFCVVVTPFATPAMETYASVLLPVGTFAETAGSYLNAAGEQQEFSGFATPVGAARPGWKILRVLGNLCGVDGFDYVSAAEVTQALAAVCEDSKPSIENTGQLAPAVAGFDEGGLRVPIYAVDAVVRRARSLQLTKWGESVPDISKPADAA